MTKPAINMTETKNGRHWVQSAQQTQHCVCHTHCHYHDSHAVFTPLFLTPTVLVIYQFVFLYRKYSPQHTPLIPKTFNIHSKRNKGICKIRWRGWHLERGCGRVHEPDREVALHAPALPYTDCNSLFYKELYGWFKCQCYVCWRNRKWLSF